MRSYPDVDAFLADADRWRDEMSALRPVLVGAGLDEQIKWGKPCYSSGGANICILQPMKDLLAVLFFKGALLADPDGVLEDQGPNSRAAKRVRVDSLDDVEHLTPAIRALVDEAVAAEEAGLEVAPPPDLDLVAELRERLDGDPALKAAFEGLTPGRQREYHLHVSGAKKAETRRARVDKHYERILSGRGLRDR